mgnify:FL=1
MDIQAGKYTLRSDSQCFWIEETKATEKEDGTEGKEYQVRASGYYAHIEDLLANFITRRFRSSDKEKMEDVLNELAEAVKDSKKIVREYAKEKSK